MPTLISIFSPLNTFSKWLTSHITTDPLLKNALEFFIFDTLKIFIMLAVLIFCVSLLRIHLPMEKVQAYINKRHKYLGHFFASLLGIITPFCTCSAIPLFLSFLEVGIPVGITFSFLIASPMINEVAIIMLLGMFGIKVTFFYIFYGLIISVVAGIIIGKTKAQQWLLQDMLTKNFSTKKTCSCQKSVLWKTQFHSALYYTFSIIKKIWLFVIIGIGIGAWIHGYIPSNFLVKYADATKWYDVPLAVLLGIPLYSNAAGVIPLIQSLTEKGLSIGTALAFMMAVTGLSLPEFLILKRIMQWKLIALFALIVGIGIILVGYLFNLVI